MKHLSLSILLSVLLLAAGCGRVQVSQDYKASTDFSRYSTFTLKPSVTAANPDVRVNNPLLQERFQTAITQNLESRGLRPDLNADIQIAYTYSVVTRIDTDDFDTGIDAGFGHRHHWGSVAFGSHASIRQYDVGILVIDMYDAQGTSLLWRGTGSQIVSYHFSPEETTAMVNELVASILAQYPPPPQPAR